MYGSAIVDPLQRGTDVIINIEIDTSEDLTDEDKSILRAIGYLDSEDSPEPVAKKKKTAKKAAAPFPTASERAEAPETPAVTEKEKPAEAADDDLRSAAVARASELLSNGHRDRVMSALTAAGAPRVSEISAAAIPGFLQALAD